MGEKKEKKRKGQTRRPDWPGFNPKQTRFATPHDSPPIHRRSSLAAAAQPPRQPSTTSLDVIASSLARSAALCLFCSTTHLIRITIRHRILHHQRVPAAVIASMLLAGCRPTDPCCHLRPRGPVSRRRRLPQSHQTSYSSWPKSGQLGQHVLNAH